MGYFALGLLILWPAVVFLIFEQQPIRRAIVTSFIGGWLFLPPIVIFLPGIPDWSKGSATVVSVLGVLLLKEPSRLLAIRPRWFDLPVVGFCITPLLSALSYGSGVYEGLALILQEALSWGLPYLLGRAYLADGAGASRFLSGIAVGGLLYAPLCLFEVRFSPILKTWVYGITITNSTVFGQRYGGFRPSVFLSSGLEVGWWMSCATLGAYLLIASRITRRWFNLPAVPLAWLLVVATVACKSTGALTQLAAGLVLIGLSRLTRSTLPLWFLLLVPTSYCLARSSGYCTREQLSNVLGQVFHAERVESATFRFVQEDLLIRAALQRPILGWTPGGDFAPIDASGNRAAITDGYWIIVFCSTGIVGLVLLHGMLLLPTALFLRRFPPRIWLTPQVAPLLGLATILPLFMIDNLSNAMLNPIYAVAMGIVAGACSGRSGANGAGSAEVAAESAEDLRLVEAIDSQARLARARPYGRHLEDLAVLRATYARSLAARGRPDLARTERLAAEDLWRSAESAAGPQAAWPPQRSANANDLAWILAGDGTAGQDQDLDRARWLVEQAIRWEPDRAPYWNTLGIVCYRQGHHHRAIQALSRSVTLDPRGGTAFDYYFLALANRALGYASAADAWRERAESWRRSHPEMDPILETIRAEVGRDAT